MKWLGLRVCATQVSVNLGKVYFTEPNGKIICRFSKIISRKRVN